MPGAQPVRAGVLEAGLRIQCPGTTRVWGVGKEVRSRRTWTLAKGEGGGPGVRHPELSHTSCESFACLLLCAPTSSPLHVELVLKVSSDLEVPGVKVPGPACGREATEGPSESQLWSLSQRAPSQVDLNFLLSYWGGAPSPRHSHLSASLPVSPPSTISSAKCS